MIVYEQWLDILRPFDHFQYSTADEFYAEFPKWMSEWSSVVERMSSLLGVDDLLYQRIPTFRILEAGDKPRYPEHSDVDFGHGPWTINLWVPLTETGPGALVIERWHRTLPMQPRHGDCVIFPGVAMHEATVQPERRVSFDARFLPYELYDADKAGKSDVMGMPLTLGHYYGRYQR